MGIMSRHKKILIPEFGNETRYQKVSITEKGIDIQHIRWVLFSLFCFLYKTGLDCEDSTLVSGVHPFMTSYPGNDGVSSSILWSIRYGRWVHMLTDDVPTLTFITSRVAMIFSADETRQNVTPTGWPSH